MLITCGGTGGQRRRKCAPVAKGGKHQEQAEAAYSHDPDRLTRRLPGVVSSMQILRSGVIHGNTDYDIEREGAAER